MHYHLKGKYASYESQPENDPKQNVTRKSLSSWKSEIIAQRTPFPCLSKRCYL